MNETRFALTIVVLIACVQPARAQTAIDKSIATIFKTYCIDCHRADDPQGNLALDQIDPAVSGRDLEQWRMIRERVKFGEMPPTDAKQLGDDDRNQLVDWIRGELLKMQRPETAIDPARSLPRFGNYVDHTALFDRDAPHSDIVIPAPSRLWRLRPQIYQSMAAGAEASNPIAGLSQPLSVVRGAGFKDYAAHYFVDEPTTGMLLSNVEKIVPTRSKASLEILTRPDRTPDEQTVVSAIQNTFLQILHREPTTSESARFAEFHRDTLHSFGQQAAAEKLLQAIYMQPEVLFRQELGDGPPDEHGRVRLSQLEIAVAISYAYGNRPDRLLISAAHKHQLATREQIVAHLQRRFESPPRPFGNPRILEFFREYFHYPHARHVFKDQPKRGVYIPELLTTDLDLLITHIVDRDEEVLWNLLTTQEYFIDCQKDPQTGAMSQGSSHRISQSENRIRDDSEYAGVYGMPRDWIWTDRQPVAVPRHMRAGVLTHPAWLVAWSGNFDNHPVQRGKWIRTHLLGGTVPDVPIGVDAILPEKKHHQFRERLKIATEGTECWRCHKKMDPLGFPFEQYDHYGRFRVREIGRPVDTSGAIALVEDPDLIGDVGNPIEMIHRLARSEHVEQVFVRHAFRYFMGRNETLGDAKTLQEAHRAYRSSGGSFRSLVVSLLSSDSFLLRCAGTTGGARG